MANGFLQIDRAIDSIAVGVRHRKDLGDIDALAASIAVRGLLQPITIAPDGALICGLRRLAAIRRLGWRTTNVWIRSGLSDGMHHLLAEQDENNLRKAFSPLEAEELYRELKVLLTEDAARRQAATQFGSRAVGPDERGEGGGPDSGPPWTGTGRASRDAARMVTGSASHTRMEQIGHLRRLCDDPAEAEAVHGAARAAIERISAGHAVDPLYRSVLGLSGAHPSMQHDEEGDGAKDGTSRPSEAELDAMALATLDRITHRVKRPRAPKVSTAAAQASFRVSQRMWVLTFADLDGWIENYDPVDVARQASGTEWASFERALEQLQAWGARARAAREDIGRQDTGHEDTAPDDIEGRS